MSGWISNRRELLEQNQRISPPRQIYTGENSRPFVPIEKRQAIHYICCKEIKICISR